MPRSLTAGIRICLICVEECGFLGIGGVELKGGTHSEVLSVGVDPAAERDLARTEATGEFPLLAPAGAKERLVGRREHITALHCNSLR